ncbi:putative nuclease HARBI1 [Diaphorina citri]|uniref:Nuclease HARBI1 n=1 Tax=Diaphorina citri TaxID=121845 RepID=A0A3Q0JBY2_DIACI|nr:putative nuclease HARBI1 [Diaphorina citri]
MFQQVVRWPDNCADIPTQFYRKGGFPSVCGCIDGTMITIDAPPDTIDNEGNVVRGYEEQYVNRHNDHAINAMAICGPNLEIYAANASWPGSCHDSRVLRNSAIYQRFEIENWRPFPQALILGDSAYPLKEWLIPPLNRNPDDPIEQALNMAHKRTRRLIENCFGVLKEKFPCLNHLRLRPHFAAKVILCAMTFHNIAITVDRDDNLVIDIDAPLLHPEEDLDDPDPEALAERPNNAAERQIMRLRNFFR